LDAEVGAFEAVVGALDGTAEGALDDVVVREISRIVTSETRDVWD
jgi:hypothetical protein